jgi:hypothetical protein
VSDPRQDVATGARAARPRHSPARAGIALVMLVLAARTSGAEGSLENPRPPRTYVVSWYNASAAPLLPAEKDPVAQVLQRRFNITLKLLGGPPNSLGYQRLEGDIRTNARLGPNDAKRRPIPDVFSLDAANDYGTPLERLFMSLSFDLIKTHMPRTWSAIEVAARRKGLDPAQVWAPFMSGGAPYAIPRPIAGAEYPRGVVWRADELALLGAETPVTVDDWEEVFRREKRQHPAGVSWTDGTRGLAFLPVFDATGIPVDGFVLRDGRVQPGMTQPEIREALVTLSRWYRAGYVAVTEDGIGTGAAAASMFVEGRTIVTTDAPAEDGSWVSDPPYVPGSIQDACARRVPGATFVTAPRPVFPGVERSERPPGRLFGTSCFGFSAELANQPGKLERLMDLVEALANDSSLYLTGMFGILGKQWTWERLGSEPFPRRLPSVVVTANTGRYWIYPYTTLDARYLVSPRVQDSIGRFYGSASSFYGRGLGPVAGVSFGIAYSDSTEQSAGDRARYAGLLSLTWQRFFTDVLAPLGSGGDAGAGFDAFLQWYHESGTDQLEWYATQWSRRPALPGTTP